MNWLLENWPHIVTMAGVVLALITILENVTEHWTKFSGVQRWIAFTVHILSALKQADPAAVAKLYPMKKNSDGLTVPDESKGA